jgi:hypothetical protein
MDPECIENFFDESTFRIEQFYNELNQLNKRNLSSYEGKAIFLNFYLDSMNEHNKKLIEER